MNVRILLTAIIASCLAACSGEHTAKSRGPIILGDSSTIVTETDPQALHDQVPDLQPATEINDAETSPGETPHDTTTVPTVKPAVTTSGNGLLVSFKEVTLSLPGITARSYGKPDLQKARSATYELTGGNLAKAQLLVSGGTVSKVSQQYETVIMLKDGADKLPLESLGKYTSGWQPLSGSGGRYNIAGLEPSRLGFRQATPAAIRNAVQQAARRQRLSRRDTQDWLDAVRSIRAANQAPATVVLRSVSWRVEGKDAQGKSFNKELRIDIPE